jgi:hypothetical protein
MTERIPIEQERSTAEEETGRIVAYNFRMLREDLNQFIQKESWGGNAGGITINGENYSCAAVNSWVDQESGKILFFTNYAPQNKKGLVEVTFTLAYEGFHPKHLGAPGKMITQIMPRGVLTEKAKSRIDAAVAQFNAAYPFGQNI